MVNWIECNISKIGEVIGGGTPSTKVVENYLNGTISWITPKDLSNFKERYIEKGERNITEIGLKNSAAKLLPKNTILFSSRAPIGYIAIAKKELCTNQGFKSIIPNENIDYLFLYYLLKYKKRDIENMASGTTFKEISGNAMKNVKIKIPDSKQYQRRIAKILSSIDDKIELNNKINDNLLNQALTIYNHKIKPFHKNGCIGDYCTVKSGFAFKSAWWVDEGIKVIKISSINQDYLNIHECSFVSADKQEKAKDFAVTFGDLLIAMTGATIGKFAMVPYTSETLLVNQRVGKFYLGNNPIEKLPFIYCTLKQSDVYTEIIHRGQGSAQANISASDIMNVSCSIPQNDIINEFNYITMPLFNLILKNQYENENLKLLRNTLLPKLMSKNFSLSNIQI